MNRADRVRWGILGTGRITEKLAPAIQASPIAELVAVASRDGARARDWTARHGVSRHYGNYAELLRDADIDAIYVALPPSLHAEWTLQALTAGRHVLCEKPLASSLDEAQAMVDASRTHQRLLMDGVMWRHHPRTREMEQVLNSGDLGRLRRITAACTFYGDRLPPDDLRFQRALGGGSLLDLGWYAVGAILWAVATTSGTAQMPERVCGTGQYVDDVDRSFSGTLRFRDGVMASFDCGFDTAARRWVEVAGTAGSLVCDDFLRPWHQEKARFWVHGQQGKVEEHRAAAASQERCLIDAFCQQVLSGVWSGGWAEESLRVQQVCALLDESARADSRWLTVPS